jgi:hypothetical protein
MSKGAAHRLKAKVKGDVEVTFTRIVATGTDTWDVAGTVRLFVERTLPAIAEMTAGTPPEDVRLVYWFDC